MSAVNFIRSIFCQPTEVNNPLLSADLAKRALLDAKVQDLSIELVAKKQEYEQTLDQYTAYLNSDFHKPDPKCFGYLTQEEAITVVNEVKKTVFGSEVFPIRSSLEELESMGTTSRALLTAANPHSPAAKDLDAQIKQVKEELNNFEAFRETLETPAPHGVVSSSAKAFAVMMESKYYKEKLLLTGLYHFDGSIHEIYKQKRKHPKGSSEYKLLDAEQINLTAGAADLNTKIDAAREFRGLTFTSELKDLTEENKAILQGFVTEFEPKAKTLKEELVSLNKERSKLRVITDVNSRIEAAFNMSNRVNVRFQDLSKEIESIQSQLDEISREQQTSEKITSTES